MEDNKILVNFDIVSLYTKVSVDSAIDVIKGIIDIKIVELVKDMS